MTLSSKPDRRAACSPKGLRPTGGVMIAIAIRTITRMPNQSGSYPSAGTSGTMIGMVTTIRHRVSMKEPMTI